VVPDGDVVGDFAVVRIHVVDGEAQVAHAVSEEAVIAAGDDVDAVAPAADLVLRNLGAGRVPDGHAIAGLAEAAAANPFDRVPPRDRARRPVQIDAEQVAFEPVVLDHGAFGGPLDVDGGIHARHVHAGAADREAANRGAGRGHGD